MTTPRRHIEIREMRPADLPTVTVIRTSVIENHLSVVEMAERGITPEGIIAEMATTLRGWLGSVDGVPVAFSLAKSDQGTVFAMFVLPSHEGLGLGRRLMTEAENWLFEAGWPEIWLTTDVDPSIRAHGFYQRLGWATDWVAELGEVTYRKRRPS